MKVKRTSVVRRIEREYLQDVKYLDKKPEAGDIIKVKVSKMGYYNKFENVHGRIGDLVKHDELYCAFGTRYATQVYEAIVPRKLTRINDFLAFSGVCGKVVSQNVGVGDPTKVDIEGYVMNGKKVLNMKDFAIPIKEKKDISLIVVVGGDMECGKTTTAASIIAALTEHDYKVHAGKITGVARIRDIYRMKDSGANQVYDIIDAGSSSTYQLTMDELLDIFWRIYTNLAEDDPDYIVLEIADGIFQRETAMLLKNDEFRKKITKLFFAAADAIAAEGGINYLQHQYNLDVAGVSGIFSNSYLSMSEFKKKTSTPVFTKLPQDAAKIVGIVTK